jgi:hypothetical protein
MHINAYITSWHFLFPGMCGRTHDLFLGKFYSKLTACIKICSALQSYEFNSRKGLIMPLKQNRLSVRNLKLDWYIYLFRKHTRPLIHHEINSTLGGEDTSCCESHKINFIKFLAGKCREIFRKELLVVPKVEGDCPSTTSNLKGYTTSVFKLDQPSSLGESPSALTTHNIWIGRFITACSLFNITLSLRSFAYEFAQHKEVPGDQSKPSKERIKNVNISNQQRRC